ncbi:hypothetical protein KJ657_01955 [Patescibacteria group bacterium]|nr:hypothetical protein [Patescibacteria group bacterium]MBU1015832.1 hypothetical protein [Patescibacteria group bacterium]MBU1685278.1 hypothetical protein [Patescibacteria group bacterium]MBU1938475.1 hypothetical protein [Patescibacteria group bacterium]
MNDEEWVPEYEIARLAAAHHSLVHSLLQTLVDRELVAVRSDDEGASVYQLTPAGSRHLEETRTQKRVSSFPPALEAR